MKVHSDKFLLALSVLFSMQLSADANATASALPKKQVACCELSHAKLLRNRYVLYCVTAVGVWGALKTLGGKRSAIGFAQLLSGVMSHAEPSLVLRKALQRLEPHEMAALGANASALFFSTLMTFANLFRSLLCSIKSVHSDDAAQKMGFDKNREALMQQATRYWVCAAISGVSLFLLKNYYDVGASMTCRMPVNW